MDNENIDKLTQKILQSSELLGMVCKWHKVPDQDEIIYTFYQDGKPFKVVGRTDHATYWLIGYSDALRITLPFYD